MLFAAGETFKGQFILRGSGTEAAPNLAAAYNSETGEVLMEWVDGKPLIQGEGKVNSALKLSNSSFWEINNIEVTHTDGTDKVQGDLRGIHVVAQNAGTMENIAIKNCYVHDVNGTVGGKQRGGIHVHVLGESVKTKFHNLLIDNNVIKNVGGVGIGNQSSWPKIDTEDYYPWTNFIIRNNYVERTGRNGIIVRYSINPRLNTMFWHTTAGIEQATAFSTSTPSGTSYNTMKLTETHVPIRMTSTTVVLMLITIQKEQSFSTITATTTIGFAE